MIARKVVCRMTKREARAWAKARRTELDMAAVGRGMAQALFGLPQWQSAGAVLAFAAMPDEPDTAEILRRALADGKRLLLPRVRSKTEMDWVETVSYTHLIALGAVQNAVVDGVLVEVVAFD